MVYRVMKICSTYKALDVEFIKIRDRAVENGYPIAVVDSVIRRQLDLRYTPREVQPATLETDTIVLRVPYYGTPSQVYGKRVTAAAAKLYPGKRV